MNLYQEILCHLLQSETPEICFSELKSLHKAVDSFCYRALQRIKEILEDPALEDEECFAKIEAIVNVFEEMGSGCGSRHDFG